MVLKTKSLMVIAIGFMKKSLNLPKPMNGQKMERILPFINLMKRKCLLIPFHYSTLLIQRSIRINILRQAIPIAKFLSIPIM